MHNIAILDINFEQDHSPHKLHGRLTLPVLISEFSNNVLAGMASKKAEAMALQKEADGSRRSFLELGDIIWSVARVLLTGRPATLLPRVSHFRPHAIPRRAAGALLLRALDGTVD
jgi:hypothetical protein